MFLILKRSVALLMWVVLGTHAGWAKAQIPGLPNLPGLPGGFKLPTLPTTPQSSPGGTASVFGLCALVAAGGAMLGKKFAEYDAKRLNLSPAQSKRREQSYMLGWGLFGCTVGGVAGANIVKNMSEQSRKAQEEAWQKAQQQTGPVAWSAPGAKGTTEIVEREPASDGGECGVRRDVIEAEEGTAEPMVRVCRVAGGNDWRPATS